MSEDVLENNPKPAMWGPLESPFRRNSPNYLDESFTYLYCYRHPAVVGVCFVRM